MKTNPPAGKPFKKSVLAAALIIGTGTLAFQGFTQAAAAAAYDRTNTLPTSYANYGTHSSPVAQTVPEGYVKANYTVGSINLPYYDGKTPDAKDISKAAAAELAAQALWQLYGVDLNGQEIEMGYDEATENLPRSCWTADVAIKGQNSDQDYTVKLYSVVIDSVTGELLNIGQDRTLKHDVSLAFDLALDQNPEKYGAAYIEAAQNLAEKYNVVHSAIQSVTYAGQGSSENDPQISFEIRGTNGEVALMGISQYDKALSGLVYSGQYKYDLLRIQKLEQEAKATGAARQNTTPTGDITLIPSLQ